MPFPYKSQPLVGPGWRVLLTCEHNLPPPFLPWYLLQVRHRCPCTDKEVCEVEEKAAQEAASQGLIPSSYTLTPDGRQVR